VWLTGKCGPQFWPNIGKVCDPRLLPDASLDSGNAKGTISPCRQGKVVEYLEPGGASPFAAWFAGLDSIAAAKIHTALLRMELGNFSNVKAVGGGVAEYRIDFGPGYRIYFGQEGNTLVILLGGGTKKGQSADIFRAQRRWHEYKSRKLR
jgi:putative addiction module killer protein